MSRILIVEDEQDLASLLEYNLKQEGFEIDVARTGAAGVSRARSFKPDLILLDLMLPDIGGTEVARLVREQEGKRIPIIMVTARGEESDRVRGLELGADDYVVKPFSAREVAARVRTVLRRSSSPSSSAVEGRVLEHGRLRVDLGSRVVSVGSVSVALTAKEFDLLALLAGSPRQVFTRRQLLEQVWDSAPEFQDPATVTVHVGRLRQKLERDPEHPRWIVTVWGVGYRFEPGDEP